MNTSKQPQSEWGKYVIRVLSRHGSSPQKQRARTGLAHTTIYSWLDDVPPNRDGVIDFAQGMGEDVNEALRIAGKSPIYTEPEPDSPEAVELALGRLIMDLREQFNTDRIALRQFGGRESLKTVADVEALRPILEEDIRQELAERAREKHEA